MAGLKTYKSRHKSPERYDLRRLQNVAICVYPALAGELVEAIYENKSYAKIEHERGYIALNVSDFYGYRRKVIDVYVDGGG